MLRLAPWLTLLLIAGPALAGLLGTLAPAFGWRPAQGSFTLGLAAWRELAAMPGVGTALRLTLGSGLGATLLALLLAVGTAAGTHGRPARRLLRPLLPALLAVPHLAASIGLAFLIAPSGWLARLASPWLTGWTRPPDIPSLNDPWALALTLGLALREAPFLLLALLVAEAQLGPERQLALARTLGYGRAEAWLKLVLPLAMTQLRLPVCAVLAFSLSAVDVALVLGPGTPGPLAVEILRWLQRPELDRQPAAAAGAILLLGLILALLPLLHATAIAVGRLARPFLAAGPSPTLDRLATLLGHAAWALLAGAALLGLAALGLWSLAGSWRFPAALPDDLSPAGWGWALASLRRPGLTSLALAATTSLAALALALACLEQESRSPGGSQGRSPGRLLGLIYLPLLLPQPSFLFGFQVLLAGLHLEGGWPALILAHLLFVLPYLVLLLRAPYLALAPGYASTARLLGQGGAASFRRVKLPLLRRPIAAALAIGFTVSLALYLPTQFAAAGRIGTLTTETLALATGGDRRLAATGGLVLAGTALLALGLAALVQAPRGLKSRHPGAQMSPQRS